MAKNIKKEYTNGELTIVWQPSKCIHAGECVKRLPQVYNPNERPWIKAEGADTNALKDQIDHCPSGALSYYMNDGSQTEEKSEEIKVEVMPDGPLLVYGTLQVLNKNGSTERRTKTTAFCRCGASNNKPYCDGTHQKIGFTG